MATSALVREAAFLCSAPLPRLAPATEMPEIAFAGRSNAGKSSLLNAMVGRKKLARTSSEPGRTRMLQFFRVELIAGEQYTIADLPGYGYAKRSKSERHAWKNLVEGYFSQRETLRVAVLVMDLRRRFEEEEFQFIEYALHAGIPTLIALSKVDRARPSERQTLFAQRRKELLLADLPGNQLGEKDMIMTSAAKRTGVEALWRRVHLLETRTRVSPQPE